MTGQPKEKKVVVIIPARMGSSRFPGKPLASLLGHPMIEHVYRRAALSTFVDGVYVATPDQEIMDAVEGFGGKAIMTSISHERATKTMSPSCSGRIAGPGWLSARMGSI